MRCVLDVPGGTTVCPLERTFGWLNLQRRLGKDYEALCETTETWLYISMTGLMLSRLTRLLPF